MQCIQAELVEHKELNEAYYLLLVRIPELEREKFAPKAGQFVQIKADAPGVLLRRPISIADYDAENGLLSLVIQEVGKASRAWRKLPVGSILDLIGPLGVGFSLDASFSGAHPLLIGGGVGVAPLFFLAKELQRKNITPHILLGARTESLLLYKREFALLGSVYCTTDDGSYGVKGRVTDHPVLHDSITSIYTCGPLIMMRAIVRFAKERGLPCEVSLENKMACGIGVCLCCVEATKRGNICCCSEGPVFNSDLLLWQ